MSSFQKGQRVQLHAACDEWMRGDRFGEVVGFGQKRAYLDRRIGREVWVRPVRVKLDSGRVRRFHPENLFAL